MKNKNIKALLAAGVVLFAGMQFSGCKKGEEDPFLSLRSRKARLAGEWMVTMYEENSSYEDNYDDDPNFDDEVIKYEGSSSTTFDGSSVSFIESDIQTYDGDGFYESYTSATNAGNGEYTEESTWEYTDNTSTTTDLEGEYSSSASMTYTFERDGTFTMERTMTMDIVIEESEDGYDLEETESETMTMSVTGTWAFVDGNNEDEFANGERVSLWYKTVEDTYESNTESDYTDTDSDDFWDWDDEDEESSYESTSTNTGMASAPDETWEIIMLKNKEMKVMTHYMYSYSGESTNSYTSGNTTNSSSSEYDGTEEGTASITMTQE